MTEAKQYCYRYPHPAVTTDCVVLGFDGMKFNVLLIERGSEPYKGRWAFPGGFLNMNESADDGARRELQEETGMNVEYIEQFHTYSDPGRDPRERVITIAYLALVKLQNVTGGDDAAKAQWFPLENIPSLAFDHDLILRKAMQHLRESIHFQPTDSHLLPGDINLSQLRLLERLIDEIVR